MSTISRDQGRAAVGPYVGVGMGGLATAVLVAAVVVASLAGTDVNPGGLLAPEAASGFGRLAGGLFPPTSRRASCGRPRG